MCLCGREGVGGGVTAFKKAQLWWETLLLCFSLVLISASPSYWSRSLNLPLLDSDTGAPHSSSFPPDRPGAEK